MGPTTTTPDEELAEALATRKRLAKELDQARGDLAQLERDATGPDAIDDLDAAAERVARAQRLVDLADRPVRVAEKAVQAAVARRAQDIIDAATPAHDALVATALEALDALADAAAKHDQLVTQTAEQLPRRQRSHVTVTNTTSVPITVDAGTFHPGESVELSIDPDAYTGLKARRGLRIEGARPAGRWRGWPVEFPTADLLARLRTQLAGT